MSKGYVYILECSDGSYYTGSTVDMDAILIQHNEGKGGNYTKKRRPVKLVLLEEFSRIDEASNREKQIQGWNRLKKEALINKDYHKLPPLYLAYRDKVASRASATNKPKSASVPEALEGTTKFRSNGKLLLTAEYVVLDGAKALAVPTQFGQTLTVEPGISKTIQWESFDEDDTVWFKDKYAIGEIASGLTNPRNDISKRLVDVLKAAQSLNPNFLKSGDGFNITTRQDFNRFWGLGTSSTLINNIANWANVDAYQLLEKTFGGSGYDIACAQHHYPITYLLNQDGKPIVSKVDFNPSFKDQLYFVYLNKKQNSRDGIAQYKKNREHSSIYITEISAISEDMITCTSLSEFELLIQTHENIISKIIKQKPVKELLFNDFDGGIKSLGAWGGDFILVTSKVNPRTYFKSKGLETVLSYSEMVLN